MYCIAGVELDLLCTVLQEWSVTIYLQVITPDVWKAGARNTAASGGRIINENKLLTSKKHRFNPATVSFYN